VSVPTLPTIEVSSRRTQAYRVLREAIVNGQIPVGSRLVASQLAEQLGLSRTPLREAIQLLEKEGFVRRLPTGIVEVVGLSRDEIEEVYAIRARLEGLAARYAALRATPEEIDRMQDVLSAMKRAARRGKPGELDLEGLEFHELIQRASRLRFAVPQLETMRDHINRYRARTIGSPGRAEAILEEHAEVLRWIKARDADRAEEAMRQHIWNAWVILSEDMTSASGTPGE
jgi:DNA-binding GntR family transcriptional regulator